MNFTKFDRSEIISLRVLAIVLCILVTISLVSCISIGASIPTHTPTNTNTPTATTTFTPTITFTPTFTLTPTITFTPTITLMPTITIPAINGVSCIPRDNERVEAKVLRITDGDTIVVEIDGKEYKLRYIGIDSPEGYSGSESTEYNRKLVEGKTVTLIKDVSETDSFDRLLRYVIVGNIFVNYEMVRSGFAANGSWPPDTSCDSTFTTANSYAKSNNLGIYQILPTAVDRSGIVDISTTIPTSPPSGVCNCSIDYNCDDFSSHAQAQECYVFCGSNNWSGLDSDKNGIACESLP